MVAMEILAVYFFDIVKPWCEIVIPVSSGMILTHVIGIAARGKRCKEAETLLKMIPSSFEPLCLANIIGRNQQFPAISGEDILTEGYLYRKAALCMLN